MSGIRPANPDDAARICDILNPIVAQTTITFSPTLVTEQDVLDGLASHSERGDPYLVAVDDAGLVVGFAKYGPFRAGPGYARTAEVTLYLAPAAQGIGIGHSLICALEDHARAANIHSLIAGISAENSIALKFHEKLGFETVGRVPQAGHKFDRFIDLVLMQKFL